MIDHTPVPYFPANLDAYAPWVAIHGLVAPYGKCQCRCGQSTQLASESRPQRGYLRGQPPRYLPNHVHKKPIVERFWLKVAVAEPTECWLWTALCDPRGYGRIKNHGRMILAHRVSYEIHYGPIPDGLLVCHDCDNPPCVNPTHFFLGTMTDNMNDMFSKGRNAIGERMGTAKLTDADVKKIRELYESRYGSYAEIGRLFGVTDGTVHLIVTRQTWRHIA